jgi:sodium/hydrogen antiporter
MHDFVHQLEHIMMVMLLMVFGGSLARLLLDHLTWKKKIARS